MDPARKGRSSGRVLFMGIKESGEIYAFLAVPGSRIAKEVDDFASTELTGVFRELRVPRHPTTSNVYAKQSDMFNRPEEAREYLGVIEQPEGYGSTATSGNHQLTPKEMLLSELHRIHSKHWIESKRLDKNGAEMSYSAPNGGGYTLEAELGVIPIPSSASLSESDTRSGWIFDSHSASSA